MPSPRPDPPPPSDGPLGASDPAPPLPSRSEGETAGVLLGAAAPDGGAWTARHWAAAARERERCERFERAVRAEVVGELAAEESDRLRAHLAECPACRAVRKESVETLARLGRHLEATRSRAAGRAQAPARRRSILVFVAAAAAFFAATRSGAFDGADPRLWASATGAVRLGTEELDPTERRLVTRGDVIAVAPGALVTLESSRLRARSAGPARLLVESAVGPRLRLLEGSLELEGRAQLMTAHGVLELTGGSARVALDAGGVRLDGEVAPGSWTDARGTRAFAGPTR